MGVPWRFGVATLLHGVGTGAVGILVALLISTVQHIGFGQHSGAFLEIAVAAEPWRRMLSVAVGGLIGALAWYWLRSRETAFVQVETSIATGARMPVGVTLFNAIIQDTCVALGGSFGREAAPREIAAMWGGVLADALRVSREERKVLVACGTGAGLAAVYSVPISGVLYTVEHVLDWDMSLRVLFPAIITSLLATAISSFVVDTGGLYSMPKYSNQWPWLGLLLWSALIGPVAGGAAFGFRKLLGMCQAFRPQGRFPISFEEAEVGRQIRLLCQEDGFKVRRKKKIHSKTLFHITVSDRDGSAKQELDEDEWAAADPRGRRDWTILVAMPAAFTFLALLSFDFPFLLGNGRAMAQVAIHQEKDLGFLVTAFFLKALATAVAIGSGAAGGTLTPSVALGATLGAIVGKAWECVHQYVLQGEAFGVPLDVKAIVAAAAFLAAMTKAPVTSVALLMEFSAQCIGRQDLLDLLLHGNATGLLESKLAIGMWLPMAIAVMGAVGTHRWLQPKKNRSWIARMPTLTVRDYAAAKDLDVQGDRCELELTNITKDACLKCFQTGLLANACLTAGVGAMMHESHDTVTAISAVGVPLAAVVAFAMYIQNMDCSSVGDSLLLDCFSHSSFAEALSKHTLSRGFAILSAALGASVPLVPWILGLWRDHSVGHGLIALVSSIACVIVANACAATVDACHPHIGQIRNRFEKTGQRRAAVVNHNLVTTLAVAASCVVGDVARYRLFENQLLKSF